MAIRAGRLIDPETGTSASNQIIVVQNGRFTAIGRERSKENIVLSARLSPRVGRSTHPRLAGTSQVTDV